ncbi:hypothetical protein GCM10011360_05940 [Primorskyibacter flagellatus]|uniref:Uncharacterized protein n=1 Tax=Primorskyibacter flagellatus TaxID=1387277 RepID=A0A916ZZW9_9RHOB|nr:hypothetical protein [Primorskyibacter flagellatus]GGE20022.1 hypothetical protein GCM10011360_05940 [Primorskyibacter flagellatus]
MPTKIRLPGFRSGLLCAVVAASLIGGSATPSRADLGDLLGCILGCSSGSGSSGSTVPPTGIIHVVYIAGDVYFPREVRVKPGDEVKFYNLTSSGHKVRASDSSWSSGTLYKNQSWSLVVQSNTKLSFQKSSFFSSMSGQIIIGNPPSAFDFGDLVDYAGNVVGKDGVVVKTADGLGYTLASLGGTVRTVGDGLTKGLTTTLGLGNN